MNYFDFSELAYSNIEAIFFLCLLFTIVLYRLTKNLSYGFLDPFHFFYAFTYGTSYGIVLFLSINNLLSIHAIWIVFGNGLIFLVILYLFHKHQIIPINYFIKFISVKKEHQHITFTIASIIFLILLIMALKNVGIGLFAESRFDQAPGSGFFIRLIDPLNLFLTSYTALILIERINSGKKWILRFVILNLFLLFIATINGAKAYYLINIYTIITATYIAGLTVNNRKIMVLIKKISILCIGMLLLVFLYINIEKTGSNPFETSELYGIPRIFERLVARILWNADMYFLSLPYNVYSNIEIDNVAVRFLSPIMGSTLVDTLVGYKTQDFEVGRLIWLYWSPDDNVVRGPTNHFDLTAFFYFGDVIGAIFIFFIAFLIAQISCFVRNKKNNRNYYSTSIIAVLWSKTLYFLLYPTGAIAWIIDLAFVMLFIKAITFIIFPYTRK